MFFLLVICLSKINGIKIYQLQQDYLSTGGIKVLQFRYKNNKYILFFYPCGNMARVTKEAAGTSRDFKFDRKTTVKKFLDVLDKVQF